MPPVIVKPVTCPVCGCLCDDIECTVEDGKITRAKNACAVSAVKFLKYNSEHRIKAPMMRKNGELVPVALDDAITKAAELLANSKYPVIYGWGSTNCEAQRVGIAIAEEVGGILDNCATQCHGPSVYGVQAAGLPTATLGQIRHRADLILYWGCDPMNSHPRHLQRYTVGAEGRFIKADWNERIAKGRDPNAKKQTLAEIAEELAQHRIPATPGVPTANSGIQKTGRKVISVDVRKTRTAELADYFIQIEPNTDFDVFQALRMLVNDQELDVDSVGGIPVKDLQDLADVLVSCTYGILYHGLGLTSSAGKHHNIDAGVNLVRDLNLKTKFSEMPMRGHFNITGATNATSTAFTGYPTGVDFALGYPRSNPGETTIIDALLRKEPDVSLVLGADPVSNFPHRAAEHMVKNPLIVIDPHLNATSHMADILIPSAFVGIEEGGTAYRMDNTPIMLKKVVDPPAGIKTDEEILKMILAKIKEIKAKKSGVA
jgi:formylmethanofuran dehydrogenase subunit B